MGGVMKWLTVFMIAGMAGMASGGVVPSINDTFDTGYVNGQSLATPVNGWQASSAAAFVTNGGSYSPSLSAFLDDAVVLTNNVNANIALTIWTDMRINPKIGAESLDPTLTNTASFLCYFNSNGVLMVDTPSGWLTCSNDVWGHALAPATNNAYVRLSVFQNYNTSTQAVFLDGHLVLQDQGFFSSASSYRQLLLGNLHSGCWLDNVWVQTNFDTATLTNDFNGNGSGDAWEINTYGYASRTLYVCQSGTNLVPVYASITNALAAWRPRDIIHVIAGTYSGESLLLGSNPSNVVFEGDAFTVGSLTVASNALVTFSQSVSCVSLTVSGQMVLASGASVTTTSASVAGYLSVSTNGAFDVTNLTVGAAGIVSFATNAQLTAVAAGVGMSGPFVLSNNCWNASSLVTLPLTFRDNFDAYAEGQVVTNLAFKAWHASGGDVVVQGAVKHTAAGRSVLLPSGSVLSNSITPVAAKIWTDFHMQSVWGVEPPVLPTNNSSFVAYVNSSGYLVVATSGGGWYVCSNTFSLNTAPAPIKSNGFSRISICQDLTNAAPVCAVFVDGNLVAQGLSLPVNLGQYTSLAVDNHDGTSYVDDVFISRVVPDGLTNDLDHNGYSDAVEINTYDQTINMMPHGSIYTIR